MMGSTSVQAPGDHIAATGGAAQGPRTSSLSTRDTESVEQRRPGGKAPEARDDSRLMPPAVDTCAIESVEMRRADERRETTPEDSLLTASSVDTCDIKSVEMRRVEDVHETTPESRDVNLLIGSSVDMCDIESVKQRRAPKYPLVGTTVSSSSSSDENSSLSDSPICESVAFPAHRLLRLVAPGHLANATPPAQASWHSGHAPHEQVVSATSKSPNDAPTADERLAVLGGGGSPGGGRQALTQGASGLGGPEVKKPGRPSPQAEASDSASGTFIGSRLSGTSNADSAAPTHRRPQGAMAAQGRGPTRHGAPRR